MYASILQKVSTTSSQRPDPLRGSRDRHAAISTVRLRRDVPTEIRTLGALENADYADIVTATIEDTPPEPERLVHATVDEMPRWLRLLIIFVQRVFLGLRLEWRASPDHLLGWKIADRDENWVRIETASWFMTAHVLMHVDEGRISVATFIRYDRRLAAFVWPPVAIVHRQVALTLVRRGIQAL